MITRNENNPNPNNGAPVEEGTVPTGKLSFRDYISAGVSLKAILDGEYDAVITKIVFMKNEQDQEKDYLRLEINLPTLDNRTVVENRFVSGYFIFEREIKAQLKLSDATMPVPELLSKIVGQPIKVWYKSTKSLKDNRIYQNMHFSKPVEETTTNTANAPLA